MITGANHTSFTVSDMEKSLAFYRETLGMKVVSDREGKGAFAETITGLPAAHMRIVYLKITEKTEHMLELIQYYVPAGKPFDQRTCDPGSAHLALYTDDMGKVYLDLQARGVRFKSEPVHVTGGPNIGRFVVYFLDPDGITLELIERRGS